MSTKKWILTAILALVITACQPSPPIQVLPSVVPFPTVTPGRELRAVLPPAAFVPDPASGIANPATAIAMANRPTPTPDHSQCPEQGTATLPDSPSTETGIMEIIARYLTAGGSIERLEKGLREDWQVLGEAGYVYSDNDYTGEGTLDILLGFTAFGERGILLVFGCTQGVYTALHMQFSNNADPPEILWRGDLNRDFRSDILFSSQVCDLDNTCQYETGLITWEVGRGRFINLIPGLILSDSKPTLSDTDKDDVTEIVIPLETVGTQATGPLRTGLHIYDWNGLEYVLSIIQLDPPRYRIQIIHEADREFIQTNMSDAIELYTLAIDGENLRYWFNDGPILIPSYTLYRLLLAYAYEQDEGVSTTFQRINAEFPIPESGDIADLPVYAEMSYIFWNAMSITNNLHLACLEIQDVIQRRPEALDLLNRYGSRSPKYSELDICPF